MPRIKLSYHTSYPVVAYHSPRGSSFFTTVSMMFAPIKPYWMRLL